MHCCVSLLQMRGGFPFLKISLIWIFFNAGPIIMPTRRSSLSYFPFCYRLLTSVCPSDGAVKSSKRFGIKELLELLEKGDRSFDCNCFDETTTVLERALQHTSGTLVPTILQRQAEALEKKGHYDSAMEKLLLIIEKHRVTSTIYLDLCRVYHRRGEFRDEPLALDHAANEISPYDARYPEIIKQKAQVADILYEKNMPILNKLSYELFDQIFSQLDLRDRVCCAALAIHGSNASMHGQACGISLISAQNAKDTTKTQ